VSGCDSAKRDGADEKNGAAWDRIGDTLLAKQVLSQLSYRPELRENSGSPRVRQGKVFHGPGEAGLRYLRTRPADLVITDMQMPGKSGIEVLSFLSPLTRCEAGHILLDARAKDCM
jgi:CheY-like chemotaxis protein